MTPRTGNHSNHEVNEVRNGANEVQPGFAVVATYFRDTTDIRAGLGQ